MLGVGLRQERLRQIGQLSADGSQLGSDLLTAGSAQRLPLLFIGSNAVDQALIASPSREQHHRTDDQNSPDKGSIAALRDEF
ncbi:hypothetical protein D9M70_545800 [compost metagenome]